MGDAFAVTVSVMIGVCVCVCVNLRISEQNLWRIMTYSDVVFFLVQVECSLQ